MKNKEQKTVLIVEDEVSLIKALQLKLENEGFSVITAVNGEEGVKLAIEQKPDLILLDIVMPKMDGLEVMKKLRKDSWGKNVPIIIMSNLSADDSSIVQGIVESEPLYYLIKSDWQIQDLINKVKEVIS